MYNIAIIGVGALGKRHLESVLKTSFSCQFYAIDANPDVLKDSNIADSDRVSFGTDMAILPKLIDVAIIATSSAVRKSVFEQMLQHSQVKNIIFEKVLFQRKEDYYAVEKELKTLNIKAWVNCPRREYESYIRLKQLASQSKYFTFHTNGGEWGLGCNAIHILDLIQYLSDSCDCTIDNINLLPLIEESKRKGYKEIFGSISGSCGKCQSFSITCFKGSSLPMLIEISGDNFHAVINEETRKLELMLPDNQWILTHEDFPILYQSQLTQAVVEKILTKGDCNLTTYEESMSLHLKYIKPLIEFFENNGMEKGLCPIT